MTDQKGLSGRYKFESFAEKRQVCSQPAKMSRKSTTVLEYLLLASFITSALCATTRGQIRVVGQKNENSWFTGELSVLQKVYDDCQDKQDFTGCLKGKALTAISRAVDMVSGM